MAKKKKAAGKRSIKRAARGRLAKKKTRKKAPKRAAKKKNVNKWSHKIKTDSTHPPEGLFKKDADTIARVMATKKVSPGGIGSGVRMVQMYINRAGKNLDAEQKRSLKRPSESFKPKRSRREDQLARNRPSAVANNGNQLHGFSRTILLEG
jgi:hypothetical protein